MLEKSKIDSYSSCKIFIGSLHDEAMQNLFCLDFSDLTNFNAKEIGDIISNIIKLKIELLETKNKKMTFYCWFDEMASQLRMSLVSTHHAILPFNCMIKHSHSLEDYFDRNFNMTHDEGIEIDEDEILDFVGNSAIEVEENDYCIEVFSIQIP